MKSVQFCNAINRSKLKINFIFKHKYFFIIYLILTISYIFQMNWQTIWYLFEQNYDNGRSIHHNIISLVFIENKSKIQVNCILQGRAVLSILAPCALINWAHSVEVMTAMANLLIIENLLHQICTLSAFIATNVFNWIRI